MVYIVYVVGGWWHCICDSVVKLIVGTKLRRRDRSLLLLGCLMKRWADTVLQLHHVVGICIQGVLHVVSSYCILDRGLSGMSSRGLFVEWNRQGSSRRRRGQLIIILSFEQPLTL